MWFLFSIRFVGSLFLALRILRQIEIGAIRVYGYLEKPLPLLARFKSNSLEITLR
jgi:hypothetical protein